MREHTFDAFIRRATATISRRGTARALAGLTLGGVWGAWRGAGDAGDKKKRRKKKKKKCKGDKKKCGKTCIAKETCCNDGDCGNGGACVGQTCACLSGFNDCQGACIPSGECCGGCPPGRVCQNGACGCPSGQYECEGSCLPASQCCNDASCGPRDICIQGICVTGRGSCQIGDDVCSDSDAPRCAGGDCSCWRTMANQTRCGDHSSLTGCNVCTSDADCAGMFPAILGVFCIQPGPLCECGGACVAPCPNS